MLGHFLAVLDDDLVAGDAVVELIMHQFVLMRLLIPEVLVIPILSADPHGDGLVDQPVPHHCPEELLPRP